MNELELQQQLEQKQAEYKSKWDSYPEKVLPDGQKSKDIPANDVEGLRKLMADINEIGEKHDEARKARTIREDIDAYEEQKRKPANRLGVILPGNERKSITDLLCETAEYQGRVAGKFNDVTIEGKAFDIFERKALMMTTDGYAPEVLRDGNVVPAISRPPQLLDYLRIEATAQNAIKFMKQSTRTNAVAPKAEGQALAESTIKYTEATADIKRIGTYIPATEEQIEDVNELRGLIDSDLRLMARQVLDEQVTVGDGTGNNLLGLYNQVGVQTQARGSDAEFDQVMKALVKARITGRVRPNLIVLHTSNHARMVMERTTDGIYILGNPADTPLQRLWGIPIAVSEALTLGTGMVLDTDYSKVKMRKDFTIGVSDQHAEYYIQNTFAIRVHGRAGLQVLRDESIVTLTSLRS